MKTIRRSLRGIALIGLIAALGACHDDPDGEGGGGEHEDSRGVVGEGYRHSHALKML